MNYSAITYNDTNNGPGFRVSLWISGCDIRCAHCHNPQLWDPSVGDHLYVNVRTRLVNAVNNKECDGLSILGGEPIKLNSHIDLYALSDICEHVKRLTKKSIWLFTGHVFEELLADNFIVSTLLNNIDVIVDGPYKHELRDTSLAFRGSSNQRLIDVPRSLETNSIVLVNEDLLLN